MNINFTFEHTVCVYARYSEYLEYQWPQIIYYQSKIMLNSVFRNMINTPLSIIASPPSAYTYLIRF